MQHGIASISPRFRFIIFSQSRLNFAAFLLQPLLVLILPQFPDSGRCLLNCHNFAIILLQTESRHNSAIILLNRAGARSFALLSRFQPVPFDRLTLSEFAGICWNLPSKVFGLVLLSFCDQLKRGDVTR